MPVFLATILFGLTGCSKDLFFSDETNSDKAAKKALISEAKQIFEGEVQKFTLHTKPANLFDPGNIIPLWDKAYVSTESGDVSVPVEVTFVYWYSCRETEDLPDSEKPVQNLCYRELKIKCGEDKSCNLVYSVSTPEWRQENLKKGESDFVALRRMKKGGSTYCGTMVSTDLNGNINNIQAYVNGEQVALSATESFLVKYIFIVKKMMTVRTKCGPEYDELWSEENGYGWIPPSFCIAGGDGNDESEFLRFLKEAENEWNKFLQETDEELNNLLNASINNIETEIENESLGEQKDNPKSKALAYDREKTFVSYSNYGTSGCCKAAYEIARRLGTNISDVTKRTDVATRNSDGTANINKAAASSAIENIRNCINEGKPFIIGVSKSDFRDSGANANNATQHFIVGTGYAVNDDGSWSVSYIETGRSQGNWESATRENNILTYNPETGEITGSDWHEGLKQLIYTVTEVRF